MAYRRELLYDIFLGVFQDFDHGKDVEDSVPAAWKLAPGDRLEYAAGQNISGTAEVVSVGEQDGDRVRCVFRKIN
jgi:hypothetical protein